jgi:hypothetical protein
MKQLKANPHSEKSVALHALRMAVIEGAIWRYEHLLDLASKAGASEEEIDVAAHEALETLLTSAETPLTQRELAHSWHGGHFRC